MAVNIKYQNLSYVRQPDAKPLDLTSFKELGNAYVATAKSLEQRAIANENAYNEMAIKMSELNAAPGIDEQSLAGKINDVQNEIIKTVDEEGTWAFSDTAVSDGAKKFLTDKGVKTIMASRQDYEAHQQALAQSDASEEFKKLALAKSLEDYNNAGGALGGDGNQRYMSYEFTLGKGHDRSVMQKEIVDYISKLEANKEFAYSEDFMQQSLQALKDPNASASVKQTARQVIASSGNSKYIQAAGLDTLYGYKGITENVTYLDKGRIRELVTHIVSSRPEFRQALEKEAQLLRWAANKQGYTNYQLATKALTDMANSNEYLRTQLLASSSFSKLNDAQKLEVSKSPELVNRYIEEGLNKVLSTTYAQQIGESDEAYEARMGALYDTSYYSDGMNQLISIGDSYAYTQRESDVKVQWFDSLLAGQLRANKNKLDTLAYDNSDLSVTAGDTPVSEIQKIKEKEMIDGYNNTIDTLNARLAVINQKREKQQTLTQDELDEEASIKQDIREAELNKSRLENAITNRYEINISDIDENDFADGVAKALRSIFIDDVRNIGKNSEFNKLTSMYATGFTRKSAKQFIDVVNNYAEVNGLSVNTISDFFKIANKLFSDEKYNSTITVPVSITHSLLADSYLGTSTTEDYAKIAIRQGKDFNISDALSNFEIGSDIESLSDPVYIISSNDNNNSEFNKYSNDILNLLSDVGGTFTVTHAYGEDRAGVKLKKMIGKPFTETEIFNYFKSVESGGTADKPRYSAAGFSVNLVCKPDGTNEIQLIREIQGNYPGKQVLILSTSDTNNNAKLAEWKKAADRQNAINVAREPDNTFYRDSYNKSCETVGLSSSLGYDATNSVQLNNADLYRGNVVDGKLCGTVNDAIKALVNSNPVGNNISAFIYPNGRCFHISKTTTGLYQITPYDLKRDSDNNLIKDANGNYSWEAYDTQLCKNAGDFKSKLAVLIGQLESYNANVKYIQDAAYITPTTYNIGSLLQN